jgi:HK97 family phage major capsid protein
VETAAKLLASPIDLETDGRDPINPRNLIMFVQLLKDWKGKPAGEKLEVPDEFGSLLIDQQVAAPVSEDPIQGIITKSLEGVTSKWAQSMDQVIALTLQKFQDAQSQARKHAVPAIFGAGNDGDPKKSFGDWACAVARQDSAYLEKHYGSQRIDYTGKAALGEASGVTGGYVVPPQFAQQLLSLAEEQAIVRQRAFLQPMTSATLMFPYLDVTTVQPAGQSPFFGGIVFNWTEEAQTRTETEPQFKMLELKAHELSGYTISSNVLLQDAAFGLEKFLFTVFARALAWYEDYAFLQGSGAGKPLGMLKTPANINVTRQTGGTFTFQDAAKMVSRLLPSSMNNAIWVLHPYALQPLVQLADSSGRIVWVPNVGGAQDKIPGTLFGRPVLISEKVPTLGSTGDVNLLDPSLYVIGDRMQIEIAASQHVNFLRNQMTWRVVERVDGQPWLDRPVTLQDGSTQVSPFVSLN